MALFLGSRSGRIHPADGGAHLSREPRIPGRPPPDPGRPSGLSLHFRIARGSRRRCFVGAGGPLRVDERIAGTAARRTPGIHQTLRQHRPWGGRNPPFARPNRRAGFSGKGRAHRYQKRGGRIVTEFYKDRRNRQLIVRRVPSRRAAARVPAISGSSRMDKRAFAGS